jgi:PAS domain-containing protein
MRDVTGWHVTQEALLESERKYRSLFESIGQGYVLFELVRDEAGRAVDCATSRPTRPGSR